MLSVFSLRVRLSAPDEFTELQMAHYHASQAQAESHCSSHKRGGDLGVFDRNQMQKPFTEAAFSLEVGEMSQLVDTDSGIHLILRTG
jgi:NIMA-interacting peptidyl-prolyl cis-trans isomerase 1